VTAHQLSQAEARRIAVRSQLLAAERPADLLSAVQHLTLLQYSATSAVAPSADLVAWSRLGSSYAPAELAGALAGGALVVLQGMVRPGEDVALYRGEMDLQRRGLCGWPQTIEFVRANDACRRDILDRLAGEGPLGAGVIPDTCVVAWESSGWTNNRNVMRMLECMERRGEVAVAWRAGGERRWDLAARIYPDDPPVPVEEARRQRTLDIFGYDYQLEMYKPRAKRRWGYFALPILYTTAWWESSTPPPTVKRAFCV
jgi:uncharacterized protein